MQYYVGWDGGGTKTAVCILGQDGIQVGDETYFGPLNPNGNPTETIRETIYKSVRHMQACLGDIRNCCCLVVGMAGISNKNSVCFIEKVIRETGYNNQLIITGDQEIALNGAIDGAGAVLVAGTGSVCSGRDKNGNAFRTGGCGYIIDDEGSGYAIGRDILKAVVRAADGRISSTLMSEKVFEKMGFRDITDLITWLYDPARTKRDIASFAPILNEAISSGDEVALRIAEHASDELSDLVLSMWKKIGTDAKELALSGGILKHYTFIRSKLTEIILNHIPGICIHDPYHTPAYGAARMATVKE